MRAVDKDVLHTYITLSLRHRSENKNAFLRSLRKVVPSIVPLQGIYANKNLIYRVEEQMFMWPSY